MDYLYKHYMIVETCIAILTQFMINVNMVCGFDFVLDIRLYSDILKPLCNLMNMVQGLQVPCWKIVPWSEQCVKTLTSMSKALTQINNLTTSPINLFQSTIKLNYQGVELPNEGWIG